MEVYAVELEWYNYFAYGQIYIFTFLIGVTLHMVSDFLWSYRAIPQD
jgi:hypothetical protein